MSSELRPQPAAEPGPSGARRRGQGADPAIGAAELGRLHGYDPDVPATWPGSRPEPAEEDPPSLSDPKAMRALAHPVRMALLELLSVAGTVTATQASEVLGESPANCAFHLRTLARYGFVKEAGGGHGRERPWTAAQRSINVSATDQTDPQAALAADALSRVWLERWMDRARRVFGSSSRVPGWEDATSWSRASVFLTAEEAVQVMREMRKILDPYRDRRDDLSLRPAGALPVECMILTSPITEFAGLAIPDSAAESPAGDTTQDIS